MEAYPELLPARTLAADAPHPESNELIALLVPGVTFAGPVDETTSRLALFGQDRVALEARGRSFFDATLDAALWIDTPDVHPRHVVVAIEEESCGQQGPRAGRAVQDGDPALPRTSLPYWNGVIGLAVAVEIALQVAGPELRVPLVQAAEGRVELRRYALRKPARIVRKDLQTADKHDDWDEHSAHDVRIRDCAADA